MPALEIWIIYNHTTGQVYVTKGKRFALQIASVATKASKYLNSNEIYSCHDARSFFKSHFIDKINIHFTWDAPTIERMRLYRYFHNIRGSLKAYDG